MAFYSNLVVNQIYTVRWLVDIGLPRGPESVTDNQFWIVDEFPRWDISVFLPLDWLAEYECEVCDNQAKKWGTFRNMIYWLAEYEYEVCDNQAKKRGRFKIDDLLVGWI